MFPLPILITNIDFSSQIPAIQSCFLYSVWYHASYKHLIQVALSDMLLIMLNITTGSSLKVSFKDFNIAFQTDNSKATTFLMLWYNICDGPGEKDASSFYSQNTLKYAKFLRRLRGSFGKLSRILRGVPRNMRESLNIFPG